MHDFWKILSVLYPNHIFLSWWQILQKVKKRSKLEPIFKKLINNEVDSIISHFCRNHHWITMQWTFDGTQLVCHLIDSLHAPAALKNQTILPKEMLKQVKAICPNVVFRLTMTKQQKDNSSCGPFACLYGFLLAENHSIKDIITIVNIDRWIYHFAELVAKDIIAFRKHGGLVQQKETVATSFEALADFNAEVANQVPVVMEEVDQENDDQPDAVLLIEGKKFLVRFVSQGGFQKANWMPEKQVLKLKDGKRLIQTCVGCIEWKV